MAIIYRGFNGTSYQYWSENDPTPSGSTDIVVVNVPVLTASHVDRSVYARDGISGSLTQLTGSTSYLIAGTNITIASSSNGPITISSTGGGGGGTSFLYSETAGVMQQTGSLYLTGSARFSNLSASNGAEVTGSVNVIGSVLVDLTQGPNQTFIISGSYGQSSLPYLEIVDSAIPLATYSLFTVAGLGASSKGVTVNSNEPIIYARIDPFAAAIGGADLRVVSGSNAVELYSNFSGLNPAIYFTATSSSPTASIVVADHLFAPADLDLAIRALKINNDAGTSGYVLTSQGAGTSPIWAAAGGGGLATGKQFLASATTTTTTTALMIGQFSWVPSDYTGLTSVTVRAIMSTDGTANHTGSLQIYNLTSGSYLDLVDTPSTGKYFTVTGSTPTLVTSSNLLTGITNFDNSSIAVYEVRVSGSTANNIIIGGVELIFS